MDIHLRDQDNPSDSWEAIINDFAVHNMLKPLPPGKSSLHRRLSYSCTEGSGDIHVLQIYAHVFCTISFQPAP